MSGLEIRYDQGGAWLELGPGETYPLEPGVLIEWGASRRWFPNSAWNVVEFRDGHLTLSLCFDRSKEAHFDLTYCYATMVVDADGEYVLEHLNTFDRPGRGEVIYHTPTRVGDEDVRDIDSRAETLRREAARLLKLAERMDVPQPSASRSVVRWTRRFDDGGQSYDYAAIKVGKGRSARWYLTGRGQTPLTWEELIETHLMNAVIGSVQVSSKWRALDLP